MFVEDDPCTDGKEDKYMIITVTHCTNDEFTCSDGACVNMDKRLDPYLKYFSKFLFRERARII